MDEEILSNLLNNAIKYSHKKGIITVSWRRKHGMCWIKIKDAGIGISADRLPGIFDKTSNQKIDRGNNYFSLGFGLSVSKFLAKLHQGNLSIESSENLGTTATITLPL